METPKVSLFIGPLQDGKPVGSSNREVELFVLQYKLLLKPDEAVRLATNILAATNQGQLTTLEVELAE